MNCMLTSRKRFLDFLVTINVIQMKEDLGKDSIISLSDMCKFHGFLAKHKESLPSNKLKKIQPETLSKNVRRIKC